MSDPEVDMDELEARLYGQVHHMADHSEGGATYLEMQNTPAKTFTRYFDGASPSPFNNPNLLLSTQTPNYDRMGVYSIPVAPINNIVVVQPPPAPILTRQPKSQKWVEQLLQKYESACSFKSQWKFRKVRARNKSKIEKRNSKLTPTHAPHGGSIVSAIDLSESCTNDDVCVISDDTSNCSDDVIVIETKPEIINIDCESATTDQTIPSPTLTDTLTLCDSNMSNDFLDGTTISKGATSTPTASKDRAISSCSSTIDYCENLKGTQQEDFSLPSTSSFSELNLDGFTSYMASNGKRLADLATSLPAAKRPKCYSSHSSDSSSESEDENSTGSSKDDGDSKNVMESESAVECTSEIDATDCINVDDENSTGSPKEDGDSKNLMESVTDERTNEIDATVDDDNCINVDDDVENDEVSHEKERFSKYWTDDMDKFYRESWGQENFSVIEQQRKMSDDPNMWKVIVKDRIDPRKKSWEHRCKRCLEFGHIAVRCMKNLYTVCCLCGARGHTENRCPDTVCTACGRKSRYYTTFCGGCVNQGRLICSICNLAGHKDSDCTDLWRRYLFTTKDGELEQPAGASIKRSKDRWCSGCGKNGHFEQNCYYYNRSHAATSVYIHSFQNIYDTNDLPPGRENVSSVDNLFGNSNKQQTETTEHEKENTDELNDEVIWDIEKAKCKHLVGGEATTFLKLLQKTTSVAIRVEGTSVVLSGGTAEDCANTKAAISRYLAAKATLRIPFDLSLPLDTTNATVQALKKNLKWLSNKKTDWLGKAHLIYKRIQMLTRSIARCTQSSIYRKRQNLLKHYYQKLNTIIIAKLKIGSDKTHMDTLQKCLLNKEILLYSYEYVFNSSHVLYPNYEELIAQLPHVPNKLTDDMQYIVYENMKSSMVNMCNKWKLHIWSKKIVCCYSNLVISNYSKRQTRLFKRACSKISDLVETLRKKNLA